MKRRLLLAILVIVLFVGAIVAIPAMDYLYPLSRYSDPIAVTGIGSDGAGTGIYFLDLHERSFIRITPRGIRAESPAWSPDGQRLAFAYDNSSSPYSDIVVVDKDGGNLTYLFEGNHLIRLWGPSSELAWSPDGQQILFSTWVSTTSYEWELKLYLLDIESRQAQPLDLQLGKTDMHHFDFAWSARGEVAIESNGKIYLLNLDTMQLTFLVEGQQPFWTPDGEWLTFRCNSDKWLFCRITPDGQTQEVIFQQQRIRVRNVDSFSWSADGRFIMFIDNGGESDPYYLSILDTKTGLIHRIYTVHPNDDFKFFDAAWPPK